MPFDLPDDLAEELAGPYFCKFEIKERVDICCMCEASIRRATNAAVHYCDMANCIWTFLCPDGGSDNIVHLTYSKNLTHKIRIGCLPRS